MKYSPVARSSLALILLAFVATLGTAGVAWRRSRLASERWEAAFEKVQQVEARLEARVDERPVLWGEATDEWAQPHYDLALSLVEDWDRDAVPAAARAEDERARADRARFLEEGQAALEALRRGTHAADATRRVPWSEGCGVLTRKLMTTRFLTLLCEMQMSVHLAEGRDLEAVHVLLDALQFGGDLCQSPILIEQMVGMAAVNPVRFVQGVEDGTLLTLSEEAQSALAHGLSILHPRLDWQSNALEGELVLSAYSLAASFRGEGDGCTEWKGCSLASVQTDAADHFELALTLERELAQVAGNEPSKLLTTAQRLQATAEALENPVTDNFLHVLDSAYRSRVHGIGRFRLLAHALAPDEITQDPWMNAHLRSEDTPTGERLWVDDEAFENVEILVGR